MSDAALKQFEKARTAQLDRNEARRMRTLVNQARGDTHGAGGRWPFELTQNAHDPGPRDGMNEVDIDLTLDGHTVTYQHNGKVFTMQDLAALLSGGSSKDFDSTETTGRFGTGFLVTHVLSETITFTGVLAAEHGLERVSILLNRAGDERDILENTNNCYRAIAAACSISTLDGQKTARFEYQTDNPEAARIGVVAFRDAVPYLYGTCEHLGVVWISDASGASWRFVPASASEHEFMGLHLRARQFVLTGCDGVPKTLSAIWLRRRSDASSGLVVVTEEVGDARRRLRVPPTEFPRIFCRFPVRASDFLPINAVIDGRLELAAERDRVLMKDGDKEQIDEALRLLPELVRFALEEGWIEGHRLGRVEMPDRSFGERLDEDKDLRHWWQIKLHNVAQTISGMPVVQTATGMMKASGAAPFATFVVPRFGLRETKDELALGNVWEVACEVIDLHLPIRDIAADWSSIADGWCSLGVQLHRVGLTEIADAARRETAMLDELRVKKDPLSWLTRFLDLVGQLAQHNTTGLLAGLLPNQHRALRSPASLSWDKDIGAELKDIAFAIGHDVRSRLLLKDVAAASADPRLAHLGELLKSQITRTLDDAALIRECIDELATQLPDNKPIAVEKAHFGNASVDLLNYLWTTRGADAADLAQQCPLVASDGSSIRWTTQRKALVPVSMWPPSAQPFAKLYEGDRVLSDDYVTRATGTRLLVDALVTWNIAFNDPLCLDTPRELRDDRLKAIAMDGVECSGVIVADVSLSQIAHLPGQLIQRCQTDENLARLLLGLTLQHVVVKDASWQTVREVSARRDRVDTKIKIIPALWLADLRSKAWIPVRGEKDGKQVLQPVVADAGNLRPLLDPAWLADNDLAVDFLSRFFGLDPLELRLLSTAQSEADRTQVACELAKIVQTLGGDPTKYGQLAAGLVAQQERERQKEKNRRFGLAVQQAIEDHMASLGLHPQLIDRGYDYDLFLDAPPIDAGTHHFEWADYLLEVKATTTGEVRLTPSQARMASEHLERFILCVVDLRDVPKERLAEDWMCADVEPVARIVTQIGLLTCQSCDLVQQAKDCKVGIRNEAALRYEVSATIWEAGTTLEAWVASLPLPRSTPTS